MDRVPGERAWRHSELSGVTMDEHQLGRRVEQLPDQFADRVGDELPVLQSLAHGGEWAELVDDLVATLAARNARVSMDELRDLERLLIAMHLSTSSLDRLVVDGNS